MTRARCKAIAITFMVIAMSWGGSRALAAEDASTVIRAALEQWRDDFNAGRAEHICDLFTTDLLYDFQGLPEQNYTLICDRLHRALAPGGPGFHYDLHIKEIIVSGDLAVVRLTWTVTFTNRAGKRVTDDEPGLDVFGRQSDGGWRIIRYIAYTAAP